MCSACQVAEPTQPLVLEPNFTVEVFATAEPDPGCDCVISMCGCGIELGEVFETQAHVTKAGEWLQTPALPEVRAGAGPALLQSQISMFFCAVFP